MGMDGHGWRWMEMDGWRRVGGDGSMEMEHLRVQIAVAMSDEVFLLREKRRALQVTTYRQGQAGQAARPAARWR